MPDSEPSRFIIPPYSYWNMQWNNFTNIVFIFWIFYAPIPISSKTSLDLGSLNILLIFDVIFMLDRILDLFAGFHKPDGTEETRLTHVIWQNLSSKIVIEFCVGFGPYFFRILDLHSLSYAAFKIPRCARLFEMDGQITEIIEYYG